MTVAITAGTRLHEAGDWQRDIRVIKLGSLKDSVSVTGGEIEGTPPAHAEGLVELLARWDIRPIKLGVEETLRAPCAGPWGCLGGGHSRGGISAQSSWVSWKTPSA